MSCRSCDLNDRLCGADFVVESGRRHGPPFSNFHFDVALATASMAQQGEGEQQSRAGKGGQLVEAVQAGKRVQTCGSYSVAACACGAGVSCGRLARQGSARSSGEGSRLPSVRMQEEWKRKGQRGAITFAGRLPLSPRAGAR